MLDKVRRKNDSHKNGSHSSKNGSHKNGSHKNDSHKNDSHVLGSHTATGWQYPVSSMLGDNLDHYTGVAHASGSGVSLIPGEGVVKQKELFQPKSGSGEVSDIEHRSVVSFERSSEETKQTELFHPITGVCGTKRRSTSNYFTEEHVSILTEMLIDHSSMWHQIGISFNLPRNLLKNLRQTLLLHGPDICNFGVGVYETQEH